MTVSPAVLFWEVAYASVTEGAGAGAPTRPAARDVPSHPLPAHTSACPDDPTLPRGSFNRGDRPYDPAKPGDRPPLAAPFSHCRVRGPARSPAQRPPAGGHADPRAVAARLGAPLATGLGRAPTSVDDS